MADTVEATGSTQAFITVQLRRRPQGTGEDDRRRPRGVGVATVAANYGAVVAIVASPLIGLIQWAMGHAHTPAGK